MSDIYFRVEQACIRLAEEQQRVTFTAVADTAQVSRATLYRNPTLRALIDQRRQPDTKPELDRLHEDVTTLRTAVEEIADRLRRHDEQIRRLNRLTTKPASD